MPVVTLDFETYYDQMYSLRKMSELEYILDPRFEVIMCSVKVGDGPMENYLGFDACMRRFQQIDWSSTAMLAHNTRFDGAILRWRFGFSPKLYLDTLSMARATIHAHTGRSSLEFVSRYLGLPEKGKEVVRMMGRNLLSLQQAPNDMHAYVDYCNRDTENCWQAFRRMRPLFPDAELYLIDTIIRMYCEPQVRLNATVLAEHLNAVRAEKAAVMARVAHMDQTIFSSNQKFAALLESYGLEVPRKISPATGEWTWALARNDRAFKELCSDEEQPLEVQAILAARVQSKSTIEGTRTEKLLRKSQVVWPSGQSGYAPVPLKYWGAHTGRLSGDGGENWQNFKRGSRIREAVEAPAGFRIVHRDASQIEARMVAFLARCGQLLDAFAEGRDVYSEFATIAYRKPVTKRDKGERFVGKTSILGLGYGMGAPKFQHALFIGNGGISMRVDEEEAKRIVYTYRRTYPEIPSLWTTCQNMLEDAVHFRSARMMARRSTVEIPGLPIEFRRDAMWLPNGMAVQYPQLRWQICNQQDATARRREIVYNGPYGENDIRRIFGGKLTENMSQSLARIIVTDIADRVQRATGFQPWLSTHDSLDYCVPEGDAPWFNHLLETEFSLRPAWAATLPLASEGGFGRTLHIAENEHHEEHNQ